MEFFTTPGAYYAFDPAHIVFMEIDELAYNLLSNRNLMGKSISQLSAALPQFSQEKIMESLVEIAEIQAQGFLTYREFQRFNPYTIADIKKHLHSELKSLYFNLTSKCNLSCSYCVYGGDYENMSSLDHVEMPRETALKAIDFLLPKTTKKGPLRIDFFG
ncbi:MAG: hypothetical protein GY765_24260, partial [bacterium]|nr:hypothetical protein [bacterium]